MDLIQLLKFKEVETGLYKIPCFEAPHFQTRIFEMEVTTASGHDVEKRSVGWDSFQQDRRPFSHTLPDKAI